MAAKNYQWRMTTRYMSDTSLSFGVSPDSWQNWQNDTAGDRDGGTVTYWYRDANMNPGGVWSDANSSRVAIAIRQRWNSQIDNRNNLIVKLSTTVQSIVRDDIRGQNTNTPGRIIRLYDSASSSSEFLTLTDDLVATAHTIYSGPYVVATRTFTLAPGESATGGQLRVYNQTAGAVSYDDIRIGVQFRNILPKDYRPGAVLDNDNGAWLSHNRDGGECHILTADNGSWTEMRTQGGDAGEKGNPPSILRADNSEWFNQRLIGKE